VIEAILETYREHRAPGEAFIQTLARCGHEPFKAAAQSARRITARTEAASD
jgi:sulfite reductase (NADPH) hemoprotein beta-component